MPPFPRRVTTRWAGFTVVAVHAACENTGLTLQQLLAVPGAEQMTRTQDGSQEQALRIPVEVLEAAARDPAGVAAALADYRNGGSDADLRTRIREVIDAGAPPPESS